ncbi:hypothetical protein N8I77_012952 [Diaporthe amygdali]|uniref:Uncharacterized protein n=1 Tax=Phomopsis amygdali TaxID=1214568 RepID=A0AAD9S4W9_PHOAM|nr:hypothetical protein N8I77_012952 [Diaporthe amygdali]
MSSMVLVPLDDAFVARLRHRIQNESHLLSDTALNHWRDLLQHFNGRSDYEIRAYIAENFRQNRWRGDEQWFLDQYIQGLFRGYDRAAFDVSNRPALDIQARDAYNPSNTFGRGPLFPSRPTANAGQAELNQQQFTALPPEQRQQYQLTSVFGGNRYRRVPNTNTIPTGGPSGQQIDTAQQTQPTLPPPRYDDTIAADALIDDGPGDQGTPVESSSGPGQNPQATTPANQSQWNPTTPFSTVPTSGTQSAGPGGGGIVDYPELPTSSPQIPSTGSGDGNVRYPDLPSLSPQIPSTGGTPPATGSGIPTTGSTPLGTVPGTTLAGPTPPTTGPRISTTGPALPGTVPVTTTAGQTPPATGSGIPTTGSTPPMTVPGTTTAGQTPPATGARIPTGLTPPRTVPGTATAGPTPPATGLGISGLGSMLPGTGPGIPTAGSTPPGTGPVFPPVGPVVPPDGPILPPGPDADNHHNFRNQRQPSIAVRLRHAINYLNDADIDRDMHFERRINELELYFNYLLNDHQPAISPEARELVHQGLEKLQAHQLYNKTKYGPQTPNTVITADMIPGRQPRLKYDGKLPLILGRDRKDNQNLLPHDFPTHPRAETIVNDTWLTDVEQRAGLDGPRRDDGVTALAQDEDAWWQLGPNQVPGPGNTSYTQNQTFEDCIASDGIGFDGWVDTQLQADGVSLTRKLWNGEVLGNDRESYAKERAVRRAGLQAALRQFSNVENRVANTPWRRVRLPLSAAEIDIMRKNTGAGPTRKYELPKVADHQLQRTDGKDDPQGFTVNMAQFWREQNRHMAQARDNILSRMGYGLPGAGDGTIEVPDVMPPRSIWGAYVENGLGHQDQYHREMLSQMRTTKKLFDRELRIAPRNLLRHMKILYEQGFRDEDDVFTDVVTGARRTPQANAQRDVGLEDGRSVPRDLDKMEIYWIRFLLTQSITPQMTEQLQPRASLFILFADKLASIFNDVSDPLFPCNGTKVSVEDLLEHIHKKRDGPVDRIKFYVHDVQMWLERLHSQGRCRYQEDWRCYGWVMRPVPTCHPEQLIRWTVPNNVQLLRPDLVDEDMSIAPRFRHLRNWHSLVGRGLQDSPLHPEVENYFLCLAYRWGSYMLKLTGEGGLEQRWKARPARASWDMRQAIGSLKTEFERVSRWGLYWDGIGGEDVFSSPFLTIVSQTAPGRTERGPRTQDEALQIIRDHIIKEAVQNDSMLWPGRNANDFTNNADEKVRPPIWSWARTAVRGNVKRFFSINRWPLQLQTAARQRILTEDADINVDFIWKPELEDPTPAKYYRPKARPYVDEKVRFKPGHTNFLIGDTPHQKQVVIDRMFAQMGRAMGLVRDPDAAQGAAAQGGAAQGSLWQPPGFVERWSNYLLSRFDEEDPRRFQEPGSKLRKFNRRDIPKSYDPRKRKAEQDARDQAANQVRRGEGAADVGAARQRQDGGGAPAAPPADGDRPTWLDYAAMATAI